MLLWFNDCSFTQCVLNSHRIGCSAVWCMVRATWNCCRLGAGSVHTIQPRISQRCHFIQSHIRRMHVCLDVTCRLHFWQNDRDHFDWLFVIRFIYIWPLGPTCTVRGGSWSCKSYKMYQTCKTYLSYTAVKGGSWSGHKLFTLVLSKVVRAWSGLNLF